MTNTKTMLMRSAVAATFALSIGVVAAPAYAQIEKANPQTMSNGSNGDMKGGGGTQNGNLSTGGMSNGTTSGTGMSNGGMKNGGTGASSTNGSGG